MKPEDFEAIYEKPDPWDVGRKSVSNKRRRLVIDSLAPLLKNKRVLEVGCGEGALTVQLAGLCREIVGVDISRTAISRAPTIANATFKVGSMVEFDYRDFDIVVMLECLYYLSEDDQKRVLSKINSPLIISAPIIGRNEHRRYYTEDELTRLLSDHGFKIDRSFVMSLRWDGSAFDKIATGTIRALCMLGMPPIFSFVPKRWIYQMMFVCRPVGAGPFP